jgi:hypothetical protein
VDLRHLQIHDEEVAGFVVQPLERLAPAIGGPNRMASARERNFDCFPDAVVVVDHDDVLDLLGFHAAPLCT